MPLYQYLYEAPFGLLGLCCDRQQVLRIDFLPEQAQLQPTDSPVLHSLLQQLDAYFDNPNYCFSLPLAVIGSLHQQKVWQAIAAIPVGQVRQYGDLAKSLQSSAQAVGQACGANPLPIVIPCHRVVARAGAGGFARQRTGALLEVKHWLLQHEQAA